MTPKPASGGLGVRPPGPVTGWQAACQPSWLLSLQLTALCHWLSVTLLHSVLNMMHAFSLRSWMSHSRGAELKACLR